MFSSPHRVQYFVRAVALFLAGFVIAFTAPMHDTAFSTVLFVGTVLALALLDVLFAVLVVREQRLRTLALLRSAAAVLSTVVLFAAPSTQTLALIVTLWAAVTAVIEVWFGWASRTARDSRELLGSGIFAGIAAILLLVLPANPVSVIGVFGGYCFVVGTFVGIAAFDPQPTSSQRKSTP